MNKRLLKNRISVKFKKEDAWIGIYWDSKAYYICIIPFFPICIKKTTICGYCHKPIKGDYSGYGYHNEIKNQRYSQYTDELVTCIEAKKINDITNEALEK